VTARRRPRRGNELSEAVCLAIADALDRAAPPLEFFNGLGPAVLKLGEGSTAFKDPSGADYGRWQARCPQRAVKQV
jgi:hypothetical protein